MFEYLQRPQENKFESTYVQFNYVYIYINIDHYPHRKVFTVCLILNHSLGFIVDSSDRLKSISHLINHYVTRVHGV